MRKYGLKVASALLRHSDVAVTAKHYAHLTTDEVGSALDDLNQRTPANLVKFPRESKEAS